MRALFRTVVANLSQAARPLELVWGAEGSKTAIEFAKKRKGWQTLPNYYFFISNAPRRMMRVRVLALNPTDISISDRLALESVLLLGQNCVR